MSDPEHKEDDAQWQSGYRWGWHNAVEELAAASEQGYWDGWADAIEECARVAELFYDEHPAERVWGKPIAAAIRALKRDTSS